jgi:hypothetical protein
VAAYWSNGAVHDLSGALAGSVAYSCNADGSIIVGANNELPFVWKNGTFAYLPLLSGTFNGTAYLMSANGTTIVGMVDSQWAYWTYSGVAAIAVPGEFSDINAISDDGSTLLCAFDNSYGYELYEFPGSGPSDVPEVITLNSFGQTSTSVVPYYRNGYNPNGDATAFEQLSCLTADGSIQFGSSFDRFTQTVSSGPTGSGSSITDTYTDGFWAISNVSTDSEQIGDLINFEIHACNVDGSILAGYSVTPGSGKDAYGNPVSTVFATGDSEVAFGGSLMDLKGFLTGKGAATAGWTLNDAEAMSGDGSVVLGSGHAINVSEPFIARITPAVSSFSPDQTSFVGGNSVLSTVGLDYPAPAGATISITSSNTAAISASSLAMDQGKMAGTLTIASHSVTVVTSVKLTATLGSSSKVVTVTVNPPPTPAITGFYPSAGVIVGGNAATASVTLASAAPAGGYAVHLASNTAGVTIPATVTVPSGAKSVSFSLTSTPVTAVAKVVLTATFGSSTETTIVTVIPPSVSLVRVAPSPVVGGVSTKVAVYLNGKAPTGGFVVSVSSNSASAVVPKTITVPAGATAANATLTTSKVTAATTVVVTAQTGSTTVDTEMVVDP